MAPNARALQRSRQPFEIPVQVDIIELGEFATFERIGASPDVCAKRLQSAAVFSPTLLEYAAGVTNHP